MASCPNINLQEWKDLVESRGSAMAYFLWDKYAGEVPSAEYSDVENEVQQEQLVNEPEEETKENEDNDWLFQAKSIFAAVKEIEIQLRGLNKTINSIGSESKIHDVLKKAGLSAEQREQFIQLVNGHPELKSLKISEVLAHYLREFIKESDRQYYKAIDEPISNELEKILMQYFDKFKIRKQELDNLKEKFGVDSIGVFDVLAKTVYYSKNRNLLTLPEEYGHVFVELLGSIGNKKADNPLFTYLFNNIENWDGYQRVLRDYKGKYVTKEGNMDLYKIKKEAIGQAIGIALVRNYKVQAGDKAFWAKVQKAIDYVLNLIKGIDNVSLNTTVDSIAKDILNKNYDKLDRMQKDTSNYNLLKYSETIENQNKIDGGKALKFMQWFSRRGMLITGSLAYRLQGEVYRPEIDALHDIDNIVPSDVHKISLKKEDYLTPEELENSRLYHKYITEGNYREARKHKVKGSIKLNIDEMVDSIEVLQEFKEEFPDTDFLYSFYNEKANAFYITINAIWSENQELKNRFKSYTGSFNNRLENFTKEELDQIYLFDFFLRPETSEGYKRIEDKQYGLSLAHFNYAFYEKLNMMGRAKDAFDYQNWDYYDDKSILQPDLNDRLVYFQLNKNGVETPSSEAKPFLQIDSMPASKASPETLEKVKQIIKAMGVSIVGLKEYVKGNPWVDVGEANGLADLTQDLIAISQGMEDVALTEEMVHVATAIIEQTHPSIITELISKIGGFKIYRETLEAYKDNEHYQLSNGQPNIRKIKKEAADKLLVEIIIKQNQGSNEFPELLHEAHRSFFRKIWEKIMAIFGKEYKNSNIDIFERTASRIMQGNIASSADVIFDDPGIYTQQGSNSITDAQAEIQKRILDTDKVLYKQESEEKSLANDPALMDEDVANNWYERILPDGSTKRVINRVTDRVKEFYQDKFGDKTFTDIQKAFNEFKRLHGVKYHNYFEEVHARFFDPKTGLKRDKAGKRPYIEGARDLEIYNKLEKYYADLIDKHSSEGRTPLVFSEVKIYDPIKDEAGTIDLLIVDPSGKTHIYDWKFMSVSADADDVAWFKKGAYQIQLKRYATILKDFYGVKEMGNNRAIPILLEIKKRKYFKKDSSYVVNDIEIGEVDTSKIKKMTLLPVSEEDESTGVKEIDEILVELNNVHAKISSIKANGEDEKEFKRDRLNILKNATRIIQGTLNVQPLIDVISIMKTEGDNIISDWKLLYKDKQANDSTLLNKELSEFSESLKDYMDIANVFGTIGDRIQNLVYNEEMSITAVTPAQKEAAKYRKELAEKLTKQSQAIRLSNLEVKEISKQFADKYVGIRNLVRGLLDTDKEIKSIGSIFRNLSDLSTAALTVLQKVVANTKAQAARKAHERVQELMKIRERLQARGGDFRKIVAPIYQKDSKGKSINKLTYKYKKSFYEGIDNNALEGAQDVGYIRKNIDLKAYNQEVSELLEKRFAHFDKMYEDKNLITILKQEEANKYDLDSEDFNGFSNYIIKKHPADKHISDEYKEIEKDSDLFALYKYIEETNQEAVEAGYIENKVRNTFLPFVRKGMAESLAWDLSLSAIQRLGDGLIARDDDVGYGAVDAVSKDIVNTIPKYYTTDFTILSTEQYQKRLEEFVERNGRQPSKEENADLRRDYSNVSEDLFKNLIAYTTHLQRYKYLTDVEGQLTLVRTVESFKESYKASTFGNTIKKKGSDALVKQGTNEVNTKIYTNFLNALLYDQKYPVSTSDIPLNIGVALDYGRRLINKVAGKEIIKPNEKHTSFSLLKTIDSGNRYFQLKTLGLSVIAGAANAFGVSIQINAQGGVYFTSREFGKNAIGLIGNKFSNTDEREMFLQMIDLFMPLKDDPNYDKLRDAGMTKLTQQNFSDLLMVFMRNPEIHVEKAIFLTLLENTMIEDGKIVSIRERVKAKYPNRYASPQEFKNNAKKIKEEIEQLKKTKSIQATKRLVNGKLEIPGLDLSDVKEVQKLTSLTRRIARNATGGMSDDDRNMMSLNIFGRSAMVFKGWIPKLVDTRFGEFRKVSDDFTIEIGEEGLTTGEKYDIGRARLFFDFISWRLVKSARRINNILSFNEDGMLELDKMYEEYAQKYMKRNGVQLDYDVTKGEYINFITRDEFIDLIRTNLRNQIKELTILLVLAGSAFAVPPPDEDMSRSEKNFYRYMQRIINRFVQELSFFYNPAEYQNLLSGNMFPILGVANDIEKFVQHSFTEITGVDFSDLEKTPEDVRKKAQPLKYGAKLLPLMKEVLNWIALVDDEFAKEFDITISASNRSR